MSNIIKLDYENYQVSFNNDGWINATSIAKKFGKRPSKWLELSSTRLYIKKLASMLAVPTDAHKTDIALVKTVKGGKEKDKQGTWLHPKLAVKFARWLSVEFEIWCDLTIDSLLRKATLTYHKVVNMLSMTPNEAKAAASLAGRGLRKYRDVKPIMEQRQLEMILN